MSVRGGVIAVAGVVVAAIAVAVPLATGDSELPGPLVALFPAAGLSFVLVGLLAWTRRPESRIGLLMVVAGFLYFLPYLGAVDRPWPWAFGRFTGSFYIPVVAHLFLTFPSGRFMSRFDRRLATAIYVYVPVTSLALLLLFDRRDFDCEGCPENPAQLYRSREVLDLVNLVGMAVGVVLGLLVLWVVARRWVRAAPPERRSLTPLLWVVGINVAGIVVISAFALADPNQDVPAGILALDPLTLMLMPVGFLVGLLRSRLARVAVGDLVMELAASADLAHLREAIARALGDPSVEVLRWNDDAGGYVDSAGRLVELPSGGSRAVTTIEGDDGPVGALVHDASLAEEPQLVAGVASAARFALENRRLREEISLSQEVPRSLAERLRREGRKTGETEMLDVTVLMSDVRGYTTISEHADPSVLARQLDEHRREMSRVIDEHGGTVMQFIGDAVFAVFGAPLPQERHAETATAAARGMHEVQAAVNERWAAEGLACFDMGIGLSTGIVAAVLLGSDEHLEYSLVGDTVNLAQRLQQWAGRGETVLSEPTYAAVDGGLEAEPIEPATVKGREALVVAYRLGAYGRGGSKPGA